MNPLDSYLARVARELRSMPQAKRDDELRELRSHLEQRKEDFANRGLSPEVAQMRTLQEFGSPRSVGSKLCDAWEGIHFSVWRLLFTLLTVTIIWIVADIALFIGGFLFTGLANVGLLPELPYSLSLTFALVPFGCGWLLSRNLGRRGPIVTLLYFAGASLLLFAAFAHLGINIRVHVGGELLAPLPLFNTLMAFCGAVAGHELHKRHLRLALASGQTLQKTSSSGRRWRSFILTLVFAIIICGCIYLRVNGALRPTTPVGILRASFLHNRGVHSNYFEPPSILEMRELAPTTPAELAGHEKWVFFRLEARATPLYATHRIAFLKRELSSPQQRKSWGERSLRRSLERLQLNRHTVQGRVRLVQASNDWKIDENSFDRSQLWAWCDDISYGGTT